MWKKLLLLLSFTLLLSAEVVNIKATADNDFIIVKRVGNSVDVVYRSDDGIEWKKVQEYNLTIDKKELKDCEIDIIAWGDHRIQQALAASFSSNGNTIVTKADSSSPIKSYVTKIENQAEWAVNNYPDDATIIDIFDTMYPDETADLGSVQNNSIYGDYAISVGADAHWIWAKKALQGAELGNNFTVYTIDCNTIINSNSNSDDNTTTATIPCEKLNDINNIISDLHNRAPNDNELGLWEMFKNGEMDCVKFFANIFADTSDLSDEEYIKNLYKYLYGEVISEEELNNLLNQLASGELTRNSLLNSMLNSDKFKELCENCYSVTQTTDSCIDDIIAILYDRTANDSEIELWREYQANKIDCAKFVHSLLATEEVSEWTNQEYISRVYQLITDSEIDEVGLNYWQNQLDSGSITRDGLIDALLSSSDAKICSKCNDNIDENTTDDNNTNCLQVITHAYDPKTGEERDFPTPCDVPDGWIVGTPDTVNCDTLYDELSHTSDLNDKYFIEMAYQKLNAEATQTDIDFWSKEFEAGLSREDFINILPLLPEFKDKCKGGVCEGAQNIDESSNDNTNNSTDNETANNSLTSFVERFYRLILGREADQEGLKYWVEQLQSGKLSGSDLANGFIHSTEFQNRNLDDTEYVKILYRAFFNREADSGGLEHWLYELSRGASRDYVLNGFLLSLEFDNLCQKFGIRAF